MESKKLIKQLEADGWELVRIKGSHHHYRHPNKKRYCYRPASKKGYSTRNGKQHLKRGGAEIGPFPIYKG